MDIREILFRGTDSFDTIRYGGYFRKIQPCGRIDHVIHDGKTEHIVNNLSVGQYTGMNDSNGVKIFENDSIIYTHEHIVNYEKVIGRVWFIDGAFHFVYNAGSHFLLHDLNSKQWSSLEVVKQCN